MPHSASLIIRFFMLLLAALLQEIGIPYLPWVLVIIVVIETLTRWFPIFPTPRRGR